MTDCKSDYAGLAQYNNGIAFKPWNQPHTYNRANPPVLSTLRNNVYGRMNTSGYHTLKNGYVSYPTNCTNVTIPSLVTSENYNSESRPLGSDTGVGEPLPCCGSDTYPCCGIVPGTWSPEEQKCCKKGGYSACCERLAENRARFDTRENYGNKPKVIVLSADDWCSFSISMSAQEDAVKKACKEAGFDVEFVNGSKDKQKLEKLAKQHGVAGFPTTLLHDNGKLHKISGMMKPDQLVKKLKEKKK